MSGGVIEMCRYICWYVVNRSSIVSSGRGAGEKRLKEFLQHTERNSHFRTTRRRVKMYGVVVKRYMIMHNNKNSNISFWNFFNTYLGPRRVSGGGTATVLTVLEWRRDGGKEDDGNGYGVNGIVKDERVVERLRLEEFIFCISEGSDFSIYLFIQCMENV